MLRKFINDENGQGMVEYILIIAAVSLIVLIGAKVFGAKVKTLFTDAGDKIEKEGDAMNNAR